MINRSAVQNLLRAARGGVARLNQLLAEGDPDDEAIFSAPPRRPEPTYDAVRRMAEARKARIRN